MSEQKSLHLFAEHELRDVPGFEGRYAASFDGRIWSYPKGDRNQHGQWLAPYHANGYLAVKITSKFGRGNYMVHRLVAMAWHANPNKLPEVNHIDSNRANNRASNLEWVSKSENITHMHAARKARDPNAPVSDYMQAVINLREDRRLYRQFCEAFEAFKALQPDRDTATQTELLNRFADSKR